MKNKETNYEEKIFEAMGFRTIKDLWGFLIFFIFIIILAIVLGMHLQKSSDKAKDNPALDASSVGIIYSFEDNHAYIRLNMSDDKQRKLLTVIENSCVAYQIKECQPWWGMSK